MKTTIIAVLCDKGTELKSVEICTAILDENNAVSARKYDEIKRQLWKLEGKTTPKNFHWQIRTAEGLRDTFGGYPATGFLRSVHFERNEENAQNALQ